MGEPDLKTKKKRIVGLKQTLRAIQKNTPCVVYLANDVDEHIVKKIKTASAGKDVKIIVTRVGRKNWDAFARLMLAQQ